MGRDHQWTPQELLCCFVYIYICITIRCYGPLIKLKE